MLNPVGPSSLASYLVQTAANAPLNAQVLGSLATGIVLVTTTTGVLSIVTIGTGLSLSGSTLSATGSVSGANPTASVGLSAVNGSASTFLRSDGAPALSQAIAPTWTGVHTFATTARTSGSAPYHVITSPADTTLTASTECIGLSINASATRQFATGALAIQREVAVQAPTYSAVGASTITMAATLDISAAPIAGTNVTITKSWALRVGGSFLVNGAAETIIGPDNNSFSCLNLQPGNASQTLSLGFQGMSSTTHIILAAASTFTVSIFDSNPPTSQSLHVLSKSTTQAAVNIRGTASQTFPLLTLQQFDSTSVAQNCGYVDATFNTSTHASWSGILSLYAGDFNASNLAKRLGIQIQSNGSVAQIGHYGATPVSQPTAGGVTTGFTAATGTAVLAGSTFTGNSGSSAYTIGDLVAALKGLGLVAA